MSNENKVIEIYKKERQYQKEKFGDYKELTSLNFASFIQFVEEYLKRTKAAYCGHWKEDLPPWLNNCKEMEEGSAPIEAYEELIKVMVLAGAALETYSDLNPYEWRNDQELDRNKM